MSCLEARMGRKSLSAEVTVGTSLAWLYCCPSLDSRKSLSAEVTVGTLIKEVKL